MHKKQATLRNKLLVTYNESMNKSTNAERVAKSQLALIARGGRKIPQLYLQPDAADALQQLLDSKTYAVSRVAAISKALIDAKNRHKSDER